MVGIVSHFTELREQMDVRIDLGKISQSRSSFQIVPPIVQ